jgi:hypothetical protein
MTITQINYSQIKGAPVNVLDFGANTTPGTTDMTAAIQAAVTAGAGREVYFPGGTYLVTDTILVSNHRTNLRGDGQQATIISFQPTTTGKAAFYFYKSGAQIVQCKCEGFAFDANTNTQGTKAAIRVRDGGEIIINDIAVSNWTSAANDCIGLQLRGRQTHSISHVAINADLPVSIEVNPDNAIDIDHYHFRDCYYTADSNPCVLIADGIDLTNVTMDGYQAWVQGTDGLKWVSTTGTTSCTNLRLQGIRTEQADAGTAATSWSINIDLTNRNLQDLSISDCSFDPTRKGVNLSGVLRTTNQGINYGGTLNAYTAVAAAATQLIFLNTFFQTASTVTLTNFMQVWALQSSVSNVPIPSNAIYQYAHAGGLRPQLEFGAKTYYATGTLTAGGNVDLYCGINQSAKVAHIDVAVIDQTANKKAGGTVISTEDDAELLLGSAASATAYDFVATNTASKVCCFKNGNQVVLLNNVANTITYVARIMWA